MASKCYKNNIIDIITGNNVTINNAHKSHLYFCLDCKCKIVFYPISDGGTKAYFRHNHKFKIIKQPIYVGGKIRYRGEEKCSEILKYLDENYKHGYRLEEYPIKPYDFKFEYKGKQYIVEFDGIQHFEYVPHFHKNDINNFYSQIARDLKYTKLALEQGYNVIRIDYTQQDNIAKHIKNAITSKSPYYFSNNSMYKHIKSKL